MAARSSIFLLVTIEKDWWGGGGATVNELDEESWGRRSAMFSVPDTCACAQVVPLWKLEVALMAPKYQTRLVLKVMPSMYAYSLTQCFLHIRLSSFNYVE